MKKVTAVTVVAVTATISFAIGNQQNSTSEAIETPASTSISAPTQTSVPATADTAVAPMQTADALMKALMDPTGEYAAYAMYTAVIEKYGEVEPYVTIREAELRHINALTRQLERLGVDVPPNPFLETAVAPENLTQAAQAWAVGEVDNIALYDELLAATTDASAQRVFTNLRRSSLESHLPMFELAAENGGVLTADQMMY